jgi:hypothetical protein
MQEEFFACLCGAIRLFSVGRVNHAQRLLIRVAVL